MIVMHRESPGGAAVMERSEPMMHWLGGLRSRGQLIDGDPIVPGGHMLVRADDVVIDKPINGTGTTAGITGYFIIDALSESEAVAIARSCPVLTEGVTVILRRVGRVG
ncbi:MAG: hypothetical protein C0475_05415 [Planctomyces sp.]|nr:hypothetical protein [Planctomyces sp.]MBA4119997.1 hypothetical protein [Isosphaera sp.]